MSDILIQYERIKSDADICDILLLEQAAVVKKCRQFDTICRRQTTIESTVRRHQFRSYPCAK